MEKKSKYINEDKLAIYSQVAHMYYELGMMQPEIVLKNRFQRLSFLISS